VSELSHWPGLLELVRCYSLDLECSPQIHVLPVCFSTHGLTEGGGIFTKQGLKEDLRSLGGGVPLKGIEGC
jgi:hypothetical protein